MRSGVELEWPHWVIKYLHIASECHAHSCQALVLSPSPIQQVLWWLTIPSWCALRVASTRPIQTGTSHHEYDLTTSQALHTALATSQITHGIYCPPWRISILATSTADVPTLSPCLSTWRYSPRKCETRNNTVAAGRDLEDCQILKAQLCSATLLP